MLKFLVSSFIGCYVLVLIQVVIRCKMDSCLFSLQ